MTDNGIPVRKKWLRFGVVLAVLHFVFLLAVVALLRVDAFLGVAVAVVVSAVGGIALTVFVLYIY